MTFGDSMEPIGHGYQVQINQIRKEYTEKEESHMKIMYQVQDLVLHHGSIHSIIYSCLEAMVMQPWMMKQVI
jgi:hypothetical protein